MTTENDERNMWEYVLNTKLAPYIPFVREFWAKLDEIEIYNTGTFPVTGRDVPRGLMYRVTNTPVRSPIKHVQVFPFVPVTHLNISNVTGGVHHMVGEVCLDNKFTIDEFTIVEKSNLPSTWHQGQIVAFVPTRVLEGTRVLGRWVYLTTPEMIGLMQDKVVKSVKQKVIKYI